MTTAIAPTTDLSPAAAEIFGDLDSYLARFAGDMADRVNVGMKPLFDPEVDSLSPEVLDLRECPGKQPYPAQAVAVEGLLRVLDRQDNAWLVGEMGTGKTPMGLWLMRATILRTVREMEAKKGRAIRVVLTAPNQLVRKWKRHADELLPGCKTVIVKNWRDLRKLLDASVTVEKVLDNGPGRPPTVQRNKRWAKPTETEVWILPRDKGKLSYAWRLGLVHRVEQEKYTVDGETQRIDVDRFYCPRCGNLVRGRRGPVTLKDLTTKRGKLKRRMVCDAQDTRRKRKCCEPMWQAFNGNGRPIRMPQQRVTDGVDTESILLSPLAPECLPVPGQSSRRISPCAYLRQIGFKFDMYIADEVHELKGAGTLQGQMFADLCKISKKRVMLTGTLVGGYAENLLHLLWRTDPHRLRRDGLECSGSGFVEFVERYGVMQTTKKYVAEGGDTTRDLSLGRGKHVSTRTKSLPGISPLLFVYYLLDSAVFLRLQEMSAHLPQFDERVHPLPMDEDVATVLHDMQAAFEAHRKKFPPPCRAWSAARACFLRWPDKPWVEPYTVFDEDDEGNPIPAFMVPQLSQRTIVRANAIFRDDFEDGCFETDRPKERRIRRLVKRNMMKGRKTWIYTELTGIDGQPCWDWMDFLAGYLQEHGIRATVLRSQNAGGPKPEDREEWIEKHAKTSDCVISNPCLVQTGLDLFAFPSIVYAFPGDRTYVLRQASRRSWRLGQELPCEVDYLVYRSHEDTGAKSVQEAALSLMAQKMESSLAIEGDFSAEGLAAMAGGADMASQLAKFIDGKLDDLDPATDAFAKYRKKLEAVMPDLARDTRHAPKDEAPLVPAAPHVPVVVEPETLVFDPVASLAGEPVTVAARKQRSAGGVGRGGRTSGPRNLPPREDKPEKGSDQAASFEQPGLPKAEPTSLRERKDMRRHALVNVLTGQEGSSFDELGIVVNGDLIEYDERTYHLVAKRRGTVRERNFDGDDPGVIIAFVEPNGEVGPTDSPHRTTWNGVQYTVSFMSVADYRAGERTPGSKEAL